MEQNTNQIKGLYVLYDRIAEQAGPIFEAVNDSVAIRQITRFMLEQTAYSQENRVPLDVQDYDLIKIAEFDFGTLQFQDFPKNQTLDFHINYYKAEEQIKNQKEN